MEANELHRLVETLFNADDVDALVSLYEPGAALVTPEGTLAIGLDAIRAQWAGFVALGGRLTVTTRFAFENGDLALLSNDFDFAAEGLAFSSRTAEVARRQSDGTWKYVLDNPYAAEPG